MSADAIDALWEAMVSIYGHRWISAYGADQAEGSGDAWAKGLAGLAPGQIGRGIDECIVASDPWPPTLPQFRGMCLGIPPFAAVRLDTDRVEPFTRLVWQHLDGHRYRTSPADKADRLLREAYELAREHVMRGGELPGESKAVAHEKPVITPATPESAAEHLERIRQELGLSKAEAEAMGEAGLRRANGEDVPLDKPLAEVEAELREHYADRKTAAAGADA